MAGEVKQLSPTEYLFTGEDRSPVVHSLRDLNVLVPVLKKREAVRRFLKDMGALTFVQPDGKKQREFPETPEGMVLRLKLV